MSPRGKNIRTIGFSLSFKLNIQFWLRLILAFLIVDIFLFASGLVALIFNGERKVSDVYQIIQEHGMPATELYPWLKIAHVDIAFDEDLNGERTIPPWLFYFSSTKSLPGKRVFLVSKSEKFFLSRYFKDLQYKVKINTEESSYLILVDLAPETKIFKTIFIAVLAIQIIWSLRGISSYQRLVSKNLEPISELANKTWNLSEKQEAMPLQEMEEWAGTLDEINIDQLDMRIDLLNTQEELKGLAVAINGLLDRVKSSYLLQARFVADASHELRTPIAAIQGYVNLLDRWGKHDEVALQESIDAIKEEAENMKKLVEKLLFMAKGDNLSLKLQKETFDLGKVAESIYRETLMLHKDFNLDLVSKEAFVLGDERLIKQAGRIMVDNAIKYSAKGGKIAIVITSQKDKVKLTVKDAGIGIPADAIPRVLDRFYRADSSRARISGGTGLGLSIAKWIAEQHNGHIEIISREGFGTQVSLVLPI